MRREQKPNSAAAAPLALNQWRGGEFLLDCALALGLLLTSASQLRADGMTIGPGELMLALWATGTVAHIVILGELRFSAPLYRLTLYWVIFFAALCLGTMAEYAGGRVHDPKWFWHDVFAYFVAATISWLCLAQCRARARLLRTTWLLVGGGAAFLLLQVAQGWELIALVDVDLWEWERFRGFSENSNQLALFCAIISLLGLHLTSTTTSNASRLIALLAMCIGVFVGRLSLSDAFLLALIIAAAIFAGLTFLSWLQSKPDVRPLRWGISWLVVLFLPIAVAYVLPFTSRIAEDIEQTALSMTRGGSTQDTEETAELRFTIWNKALDSAARSAFLGSGPGPHLDIPDDIVSGRRATENEPAHVEHPEQTWAPNFEAHNTYLDLLVQGGVIAILNLLWLAGGIVRDAYRAGMNAVVTMIIALASYAVFHFIYRQPIVWFALVMPMSQLGTTMILPAVLPRPSAAREPSHYPDVLRPKAI